MTKGADLSGTASRHKRSGQATARFHEVFHAATILAYLTQYAAVSLVVYRAA